MFSSCSRAGKACGQSVRLFDLATHVCRAIVEPPANVAANPGTADGGVAVEPVAAAASAATISLQGGWDSGSVTFRDLGSGTVSYDAPPVDGGP